MSGSSSKQDVYHWGGTQQTVAPLTIQLNLKCPVTRRENTTLSNISEVNLVRVAIYNGFSWMFSLQWLSAEMLCEHCSFLDLRRLGYKQGPVVVSWDAVICLCRRGIWQFKKTNQNKKVHKCSNTSSHGHWQNWLFFLTILRSFAQHNGFCIWGFWKHVETTFQVQIQSLNSMHTLHCLNKVLIELED